MLGLLLLAHILGATVLFGTGAGIAFFMLLAHLSRDPRVIAHVAGSVVIADTIFTATAVIAQPITGYALARLIGWPLTTGWIEWSLALYGVAGIFWLPVVWIQLHLRGLAESAARKGTALPARYHTLFTVWFACGFPAFFAVLAIIWLMSAKPDIAPFWTG